MAVAGKNTEKAVAPGEGESAADTADVGTDRVAAVSRTKDGEPDQSADYEVIVPAADRRAAQNRPADNDAGGGA